MAAFIALPATVERITDGDTVRVLLTGLKLTAVDPVVRRLRWRDYDAEAAGTPAGDEATAWLQERLSEGEEVLVHAYEGDQFGRIIGDIRAGGNYYSVSKAMAKAGHASERAQSMRVADLPAEFGNEDHEQ